MNEPTSTISTRLREALGSLRPAFESDWQRSGARERSHYVMRLLVVGSLLLCDLILAPLLYHADFVRPGVADAFWLTHVAPIGLDFLLSALFLRRWTAASPWIITFGALIEVFASLAWVQMTGSVSSYFIAVLFVLPLLYRAAYTFRLSLMVTVVSTVGLLAVFALEHTTRLPYASLFADGVLPPPPPGYRRIAMVSITTGLLLGFLIANAFVVKWQRSMQALEDVKLRLREAEQQVQLGRLSGTMVGGYELSDLLGRGGMGEVYAGRDARGREVAVKLLHAHLGEEPEMRVRLRRESEVARKMPAGTVAGLIEHGTTPDGYDFIVMERLRGEDLGARLRRDGRLEAPATLAILRRIAVALDAAHGFGVIHRDLKPPNIFLCNQAREDGGPDVRLLDFGVARLLEVQQTAATAGPLGTPGYFAPEQATGLPLSPATDVFALGCIAYRVLTGDMAFTARQPAAALRQVLVYQPRAPSQLVAGLSLAVDEVFTVAFAVEPARRQATASQLVDELAAALGGQAVDGLSVRAQQARRAAPPELDPTLTGTSVVGEVPA